MNLPYLKSFEHLFQLLIFSGNTTVCLDNPVLLYWEDTTLYRIDIIMRINSKQHHQPFNAAPCCDKLPSDMMGSRLTDDKTECATALNVNDLLSYFRASGGSLVPDMLMSLRDMALLKKCLNDSGTSLPFLQGEEGNNTDTSVRLRYAA